MGHLNCDLLTTTPHCYTKRLNCISESFNLKQIITEPTRITETNETLLDVIYCSNASKICKSGVIHAGISDHSVTYAIIGKNKNKAGNMVNTDSTTCSNKQNHNYKTSRSYKRFNEQIFLQDLAQTNWNPVLNTGDVDLSAELFEKMFLDIIDKHVPFKKSRTRKKTSPWRTNEVLNTMRERDKLKVAAIKSGNDHSCWEKLQES